MDDSGQVRVDTLHPAVAPRWWGLRPTGWAARMLNVLAVAGPHVAVHEAVLFAIQHGSTTRSLRSASAVEYRRQGENFARFAERFGVVTVGQIDEAVVAALVGARTRTGVEPSAATSHLRCSALRWLFRAWRGFGLMSDEPTIDLILQARATRSLRSLTEDELEGGHWAAGDTLYTAGRASAVWALAESGLWTAEIAAATTEDIDIASATAITRGSTYRSPRTVELTAWATFIVRNCLPEAGRVAYDGADPVRAGRISVAANIRSTFKRAGISGPGVAVESVTLSAGARVLATTGRIDRAAAMLGLRSLDRTAQLLGFDWPAE